MALGSATGRAHRDRSARERASGVGQSAVCPATALIDAAQAATRSKGAYLRAQYERIKRRHGHNQAIVAVAHSILIAAYHVLRDDVEYYELGGNYFSAVPTPPASPGTSSPSSNVSDTASRCRKKLHLSGRDF